MGTIATNVTKEETIAYLEFLNDETTKTMIPTIVMLVIFAIVGLIGNSLVLAVYAHKFGRTTTRIFIMSIACFDLVSNAVAIPGEIYDMFHYWDFTAARFCAFRMFFNAFTTISAALVLLAVAVVRFRKVCHPHRWQMTIPQTKIICLVVAVASVFFSLPNAIVYGRRTKETLRPDIVGYECGQDDNYVYTIWPILITGLFLLLFLASFISLVVIYSMIGVQAWRHSKVFGMPTSPTERAVPRVTSCTGDSQTSDSDAVTKTTCDSSDSPPCLIRLNILGGNRDTVSFNKTDNKNGAIAEREDHADSHDNFATVDLDHVKPSNGNAKQEENQNCRNNQSPVGVKIQKARFSDVTGPTGENSSNFTDGDKRADHDKSGNKVQENLDSNCDSMINESKPLTETGTAEAGKVTHPPKSPRKSTRSKSSGRKFVRSISRKMSVVRAFRSRSSSAAESPTRRGISRTTVMLFSITLVYVVSLLPHLGCMFYTFANPGEEMTDAGKIVFNLFLRFYFLNSAANPVIYSLCDIKFRKACLSLFTFGKKR